MLTIIISGRSSGVDFGKLTLHGPSMPRPHFPRRVRRRRGRRRFVYRERAFFVLQQRLGGVEERIDEHLCRLHPICIW